MSAVGYFIPVCSYHFVVDVWRTNAQNPGRMNMKRNVLSLLLILLLIYFALSPTAHAVCQQGCDLTKGNVFLGDNALISNTTGGGNTAIGAFGLKTNTTGNDNTAIGNQALIDNTTSGGNAATGFGQSLTNA